MRRALRRGLPALGGVAGGLADLVAYGKPDHALRTGLALTLDLTLGLGIRLWLTRPRSGGPGNASERGHPPDIRA